MFLEVCNPVNVDTNKRSTRYCTVSTRIFCGEAHVMKYVKVTMNRKNKCYEIKFPCSDTRECEGKIYLLHILHWSYMSVF
jgi:hypothetical protein